MRAFLNRKGARHTPKPPRLSLFSGPGKSARPRPGASDGSEPSELAAHHSEDWFQGLVESAPIGVGICNYRGDVIGCNAHWRALAALGPDDPARACGRCFEPAQHRRLIAHLRKAGLVDGWESAFRRKDGTSLATLVRMKPIRLGKEELVLTVVQDMTRQSRAEKHVEGIAALLGIFASKTSRDDYLTAVVRLLASWCQCRCVGIRLLQENGQMPFVTQRGFGRSFLKGENRVRVESHHGCACFRVLTGHPRLDDTAWSSPNGSFFCNEVSHCVAEWGEAGKPGRRLACAGAGYQSLAHVAVRHAGQLLGTLHLADPRAARFPLHAVTFLEAVAPLIGEALHRFAVERSLAESEARFRLLFERHDAAMLLLEPKSGAITDANPAAAAFYGYSRERLREMNITDLNALPQQAQRALRSRALREGRFFVVVPHRLANGQLRTVEVHGSIIEVQGKPLLFSIIHDITERKLLEKAILEISEKERQRVGHDLHDSLGSKLSGAALMAKALAQQLAAKAMPEAALAEEVVACVNQSLRQTRDIAHDLAPAELAASSLIGALEDLADETRRLRGVSCRFEAAKGLPASDRFTSIHLFRIAQEAVHNAVRHGVARHITLRLTPRENQTCLEIADDGTGFEPNPRPSNGLGLRSMKYRAGVIGAQFTMECDPGAGTTVRCLVPFAGLSPSLTQPG